MHKKGQVIIQPIPIFFPSGGGSLPDSAWYPVLFITCGLIFFLFVFIESLFHPYWSTTLLDKIMDLWIGRQMFDYNELPIVGILKMLFRLMSPMIILGALGYIYYRAKVMIENQA